MIQSMIYHFTAHQNPFPVPDHKASIYSTLDIQLWLLFQCSLFPIIVRFSFLFVVPIEATLLFAIVGVALCQKMILMTSKTETEQKILSLHSYI